MMSLKRPNGWVYQLGEYCSVSLCGACAPGIAYLLNLEKNRRNTHVHLSR